MTEQFDHVVALVREDNAWPCGCTYSGENGEFQFCERCRCSNRCNDCMLADSEDWKRPVCSDCFADCGGVEPS